MDSIFAKFILLFASILSVVSAPNYLRLETDDLNFDFKTGGNYPIYYFLNVQNIGPGKERFEISSDEPWVSVYREGTNFVFVELPPQAYVNFVLEIRPERLPDGANKTEVHLKVLDIESLVSQEVVLDEAEVSIALNKNIVQTLSPAPTPTFVSEPARTPLPAAPDLSPILKQLQALIDSLRLLLSRLF